jgi:hypothetical protein
LKCFLFLFHFLLLFFVVLGFELGLHLEPLHGPFFVIGYFGIGFLKLFAQAVFDLDPPDLCFLSS